MHGPCTLEHHEYTSDGGSQPCLASEGSCQNPCTARHMASLLDSLQRKLVSERRLELGARLRPLLPLLIRPLNFSARSQPRTNARCC